MNMGEVEAIEARLRTLAFGGSDIAVIKYAKIAGLRTHWQVSKSFQMWDELVLSIVAADAWMILNGH